MKKWKLISSEPVFESKWLSIYSNSYELPNGNIVHNYYHLKRPDYVLIIAHKNDELVIEKQYRRGVNGFLYELPAGWIDKGENPIDAAKRELREETGLSGDAKLLGKIYPQPGFSSMKCYVVEIKLDDDLESQELGLDEEITYNLVNFKEVEKLISQNEYKDMGMLSALQLFNTKR